MVINKTFEIGKTPRNRATEMCEISQLPPLLLSFINQVYFNNH